MRAAWIVALVVLLILVSGCGEDEGGSRLNLPPTVGLTAGPMEGETVHYSVRLEWAGQDPDGYVTRYEYAVDPPPEFTAEELAGKGPTIRVEEHPGFTRVNKVFEDEVLFFDWIHTTDYSHRFRFSATRPGPAGPFRGMHTVYVRSVDDDGAVSDPDKVAFTAETIAPETRITRPDISAELSNVGTRLVVEWTGEDPDGPGAKKPVGYLFRLLRLDTLDPPIPLIFATEKRLFDRGDGVWTFQSEPELTLDLVPRAHYIFGVRAVDEAGAEEPFLDFGRNCFKFQAFEGGSTPYLLVCGLTLGCFEFRGVDDPVEVQIGTNSELVFTVSCSGEAYGEICNEWRWGLDMADLKVDMGWSEWTTNPVLPPIEFTSPGIHVLYIEARDALGSTALASIMMEVVSFSLNRDVLYVDDFMDSTFPTDNEHDDFWRRMLQNYPDPLDWKEFHSRGPGDDLDRPDTPTLEELGRYKLVVWNCGSWPSALLVNSTLRPTLPGYLMGGGKLWVQGRTTVASMKPPFDICASLDCDQLQEEGHFIWDFMKIRSTHIDQESGSTPKNFFTGVRPYPGVSGVYDSMTVDTAKLSSGQPALTHVDAVFAPVFGETDPAFVGEIDTLYAYRAYGNEALGELSGYHNKLTALRWHDPDPDPLHGRIQWFGFPLYYMFEDQAQDTFNKTLDWFREGP